MKTIIHIAFFFQAIFFSFNTFALEVSKEAKGGASSVNEVIRQAKKDLATRSVHSRAYPTRGIVRTVRSSIIHRLLVVENTSKEEINKEGLSGLYGHIEKHGMSKLSLKKSSADARGLMQITKGAYDYVKPLYHNAGIGNNFSGAVKDPVVSAKIAILFVDSSLAALDPDERQKVMKDDVLLHDYIATAYNGGISYAMRILRKGGNFTSGYKTETREYVAKMRLARNTVPA